MTVKVQQFQALAEAIQFAAQHHKVTGQNIANLNTPGYQAQEIQFDQLLQRLDGQGQAGADFQTAATEGLSTRSDGNNVDLDHELAALKKNALAYQTLTQLLGSKMGILKQAMQS